MSSEPLICNRCGVVIGIYEPLVVVTDDTIRRTSLAADPSLPLPGAEHYHGQCFEPPARGAQSGARADDEPAAIVPIKRRSDRDETERAPRSTHRHRSARRMAG
jgi:hypothetical protein